MEFSELQEILKQFDSSTVRVLDLSKKDFHLFISKDKVEMPRPSKNELTETQPTPEIQQIVVEKPVISEENEPAAPPAQPQKGKTIDSPLVGVTYLSPAPGEPAFKSAGDKVKKGDVLCIVEAMKLMNEITSDTDGVIEAVLVENEEVVEYGQPLFQIV
ncbi:acetyl-CoA carboxylase biotin carboxyl carrier protein [Vagococcus elongatus]|uniref:Biotin carboxyl carrier protein of acetyl-CoA carboxylase n=1 Tax=Vagococcus elongatus TaxID=180344 RepID=A0A430ART5_9ENTE|nr:acetyl-CoA carboxylase biotin carboxyl carrier protein [Vagococcus elongatus]RSU10768.1 acetyl-CoA carboxylase, biotin carboxyl carrier protein [Vagococcus elongatus]